MLTLSGAAQASYLIDTGWWDGTAWHSKPGPVSPYFQLGIRVTRSGMNISPPGATWVLEGPIAGWVTTPPAVSYVSQRNAYGSPIEWIIATGPISTSWQVRNGTWHATCTLTWPGMMVMPGTQEVVTGTFGVRNLEINSVGVGRAPDEQLMVVRHDEPFVTFDGAGTARWSSEVGDGSECPTDVTADGLFTLTPLAGAFSWEAQVQAVTPTTFVGDLAVPWNGAGLYDHRFQVWQNGTGDETDSLSTVHVTGAVPYWCEVVSPRKAVFEVRVRLDGDTSTALSEAKHRWYAPNGALEDAGGPCPETAGIATPIVLPAHEFPLAGDWLFAAAYKDSLGDRYHEGSGKWTQPAARGFTVPGCALASGGDYTAATNTDPIHILPPAAEFTWPTEEAWVQLGEVFGLDGSETFYSGGGPRRGIMADATKEQFISACEDPLNQVIQFSGHGAPGVIQFNREDDSYYTQLTEAQLPTRTPKARLVVLNACLTMHDAASKSGIGYAFQQRVAEAVVGYTDELLVSSYAYMNSRLWEHLTKDGMPANLAVVAALQDGASGLPGFATSGASTMVCSPDDASTKLWPAFALR